MQKKYGIPLTLDDIYSHSIIGALDPETSKPITQAKLKHKYTQELVSIDLSKTKINIAHANHVLKIGLNHNHIFWGYTSICDKLIKSGKVIQVLPEYYYEGLEYFLIAKKNLRNEEIVFIDFIKNCINGTLDLSQ